MPDPIDDPLDPAVIDAAPTPCERLAEFDETFAENLAGPKRVRGESGEVEQHSIGDMIRAKHALAADCAARKPGRGMRLTKLIPGGQE
jgi:hypothetical protein